ncbi:MAG: hypothetical protein FJ309_09955 [Planctomycetes bacterium]|nr:hypothetical protein [Planctomycetota bacterium]
MPSWSSPWRRPSRASSRGTRSSVSGTCRRPITSTGCARSCRRRPRARDAFVRDSFHVISWAAGVSAPTEVELVRSDGSRHTVTVKGVGHGARRKERTVPASSPPSASATARGEVLVESPPFRCLLLPGDRSDAAPIAFIDFPSMDFMLGGQWEGFIDQAIAAANERGAAGLIVDIRENPGGNTLGDDLLARITDRPFRGMSRIVTRRSAESDAMMRLAVKPMWRWLLIGVVLPRYMPRYVALEHGEDMIDKIAVRSPPRVEPRFDGPACLLTGDGTFSAAVVLADAARTYDLMLTVGEPTGGCPNQIGYIGPFQLPRPHVRLRLSPHRQPLSGDGRACPSQQPGPADRGSSARARGQWIDRPGGHPGLVVQSDVVAAPRGATDDVTTEPPTAAAPCANSRSHQAAEDPSSPPERPGRSATRRVVATGPRTDDLPLTARVARRSRPDGAWTRRPASAVAAGFLPLRKSGRARRGWRQHATGCRSSRRTAWRRAARGA